MKDYYEILEVNKTASEDTIKKVFRILIKKNHPDLFEGAEKKKAEEKVKLLNEAYEVLIDKEKREEYDLELESLDKSSEETVEFLTEENEYLKNIIDEKNSLIRKFIVRAGLNPNDYEDLIQDKPYNKNNIDDENNVDMYEDYSKYKRGEILRKIASIAITIIISCAVIWAMTGINLFKVFIEIFKIAM